MDRDLAFYSFPDEVILMSDIQWSALHILADWSDLEIAIQHANEKAHLFGSIKTCQTI